MRLIFLGTSSGSPTKTRNVTGLAVSGRNCSSWSLFDCGEGTQHQIQKTKLSLFKLRRIWITHLHGDHIYGLAGLLNSRSMEGCEAPLHIYGPRGIEEFTMTMLRISQSHLTYDLLFHEIPDVGEAFDFDEESITAVPLSHNVTSFAFVIKERPHQVKINIKRAKELGIPFGPQLGQLKKGQVITLTNGQIIYPEDLIEPLPEGRKIIISGDNNKPELLLPYLPDTQLWVHEATYTEEVLAKIPISLKHSTAKSVCEVADKAGIKNLILTHFSVRFRDTYKEKRNSIDEIYQEARNFYKKTLFLARDFDEYVLDTSGKLTLVNKETPIYHHVDRKVSPRPLSLKNYDFDNVKFALESGLGKLSKNLRILGFDVVYSNDPQRINHIIQVARKENRLFLTRNRKILMDLKKNYIVFIEDTPLSDQLKFIINNFGLKDKARPLSRCIGCNKVLRPVSKKSVKYLVPQKVYLLNEVFSTCTNCHKIYWRGSHYNRMLNFVTDLC